MTGQRPRLLDAYSGAGGAAVGYARAGFDVVGVDIVRQPRYPFEHVVADALDVLADREFMSGFDAVHASPPCQRFSALSRATGHAGDHPDLVAVTRAGLLASGLPWVIENVPGAPLLQAAMLCGAAFGLEIVRHRLFETSFFLMVPPCAHVPGGTTTGRYVAFRHSARVPPGRIVPPRRTGREFRRAAGVEWMTLRESREAIPPRFTEHIGTQLLDHIRVEATA